MPVSHRAPNAFGYAIVEDARPGHLDAKLAEQLGVKPGPDFGRLQRGETVGGVLPEQVMGPEREGRKIVLSGDTEPVRGARRSPPTKPTCSCTRRPSPRRTPTAPARPRTAPRARPPSWRATPQVRALALTHISTRYAGGQLRDEARAVFAATEAPRDFDTIEVPFPERGRAKLERWSDRQARERAGGASAPAGQDAETQDEPDGDALRGRCGFSV